MLSWGNWTYDSSVLAVEDSSCDWAAFYIYTEFNYKKNNSAPYYCQSSQLNWSGINEPANYSKISRMRYIVMDPVFS
jgi:hypothetical protein